MESILIVDRQPVLRLGLRLFLASNFKTASLYEATSVSQLLPMSADRSSSIVILGLSPEDTRANVKELKLLRQLYPASSLIVYTDHVGQQKLFQKYLKGVKAIISKQENSVKLLRKLAPIIKECGS